MSTSTTTPHPTNSNMNNTTPTLSMYRARNAVRLDLPTTPLYKGMPLLQACGQTPCVLLFVQLFP
jgi:hypothetical protein